MYNMIFSKDIPETLINSHISGINTCIIDDFCHNDTCNEPSKKHICCGSRVMTADLVKAGISKHFDCYLCCKIGNCHNRT